MVYLMIHSFPCSSETETGTFFASALLPSAAPHIRSTASPEQAHTPTHTPTHTQTQHATRNAKHANATHKRTRTRTCTRTWQHAQTQAQTQEQAQAHAHIKVFCRYRNFRKCTCQSFSWLCSLSEVQVWSRWVGDLGLHRVAAS